MIEPNRVSLDVIDVARPCPADWNEMTGDDRVRFCRHCSLHVYNLSAMPRGQAERLVNEHEGRLCVRFYRRADGTVITADCEGGWRLRTRQLGRVATGLAMLALAALAAPFAAAGSGTSVGGGMARTWDIVFRPWTTLQRLINAQDPLANPVPPAFVMGQMAQDMGAYAGPPQVHLGDMIVPPTPQPDPAPLPATDSASAPKAATPIRR